MQTTLTRGAQALWSNPAHENQYTTLKDMLEQLIEEHNECVRAFRVSVALVFTSTRY